MRRSWLRSFWAGLIVVGAAAGYLVSSGLGERLLHDEIETQLTRLLQGPVAIEEVKVRFEGGLRLEARQLEAFPSGDVASAPAIRARRVIAWIDVLALLIGRLELSTLVLEGPFLRVEQDSEGRFLDLPLPALALGPVDEQEDTVSEAVLTRIEGLDDMAESLFDSIRAADRIEILDGTIQWLRHAAPSPDPTTKAAPTQIRFELFSTIIERDWLSEDLDLQFSAVVLDGQHAPFPIGAAIERGGEETTFDWTLTMSQIPLEAAQTPLSFIERIDGLSGQLTTAVHLESAPDGSRRLTIDGQIHDAIVGLRRSQSQIHREKVTLHAEIGISEDRLQLLDAHVEGELLGIDLKGSLERPIRPNSNGRIESRMVGIELEDLFELSNSLAGESEAALAFSRFVEPVQGGHILYIEVAGSARLRRWQDLAAGRVRELPDGFVLGGAFEDIDVSAGPEDQIEGLRGELEWVGDQITLRNTTGSFRGTPLPEMNLVLEGASHLLSAPTFERNVMRAPSIPGIGPLIELIKPRDPNALPPVKAIGLAIDHLEHPVFRFPFRDLRMLIEPQRRGMDLHVRSGFWGGAEVTGEMQLSGRTGTTTLTARLVLAPVVAKAGLSRVEPTIAPEETPPPEAVTSTTPDEAIAEAAEVPASAQPTERWGKGRFEIEFRPRPYLPFRTATGFIRLDGSRLVGNEVQFEVERVGQLASRIVLDLKDAEQVGVDLSFALTDARLEQISEFIALPPDLATGAIGAAGSLRGSIRPSESLIARLDGRIRAEASDGLIRTEVPLLLRLSRASEGFNPFANERELRYETMTASIDFRQGSLLAEDFEIEGPLRIYARGRIDPLAKPSQANGVVGIFLFRAPNQILESLPLVRYFLPGSERGLIGAYFEVEGALAEPKVEALTVDTLMTVVPSAIKAPFKVLQYLFDPSDEDS